MDEKVKAVIHQAVVDALVQRGTPAGGSSSYGWMADDYAEARIHMAHCRPDYAKSTWDDSEWYEFAGTMDPDVRKQGIDLKLTCRCGLLTGRAWRYSDGYADLIRAITS